MSRNPIDLTEPHVRRPWLVLVGGVVLALCVAAITTAWLMAPPFSEMASLIGALAATSILSLGFGFVLYRRGWTRSPSLMLTLVVTYVWAALLTMVNVWALARLMFVNTHDLTLATILIVFAGIIATSFGMFVSASVTDGLRQLALTARSLADGDLHARAAVDGRDEVAEVAATFNDMAVQLQRVEREREELETLRRELVAWTSHDLRTPLTSMRVMIEALNDGVVEDTATRQRYFRTLQAEVVALNDMIDDLFELAQLDAGGLPFQMEPSSLADLISDTLESLKPIAEARGIRLSGTVAPEIDPVTMDAAKIGRVLDNLVDNALQHTPSGGNIELTAGLTANAVKVVVEDSGPGFSEQALPRVFEKFFRGESSRSRRKGGAGLGLAISSAIIEAHGGKIWASNSANGGAVVAFTLPTPGGAD